MTPCLTTVDLAQPIDNRADPSTTNSRKVTVDPPIDYSVVLGSSFDMVMSDESSQENNEHANRGNSMGDVACHLISRRVTHAASEIFKPNPTYALVVSPCSISIPKSPRLA